MKESFDKIKERVCEFIHERNKSGSTPCKNQRASCFQLIRVCDLTAIINQVAEEYSHVSTCYLQSPCEYQTKDIIVDVNSGWIPCSERFPESYVDVLVTVRNFEYPQIGHLECGIWYADDDVRFLQDAVIAWQPLPKPYELERRATNEN